MDGRKEQPIDRFLGRLQCYVKAKDRGALADLRRGFSEATENRAWPYLAEWCDLRKERDRRIWQTVAAGFATLEKTVTAGNMGATLRAIAIGNRKDRKEALKSFDGRFRRLLTCHTAEDVCERLPGILRAAKQKEKDVDVDFRQLFWDLVCWSGDKRDVKVEWAAAYWGAREKDEEIEP